MGYLNVDRKGPTPIIADPLRFGLVQRLWEYAASGVYSIAELQDIAAHRWGLRTLKRRLRGGAALSASGIYQLLANPFYAGIIRHGGKEYPGKHPAMVSLADFATVQRILRRSDARRPSHHHWDYTGLLRCVCGYSITAEHKTNRFGSRYAYYHCCRRKSHNRCPEPSIELRTLESSMREFVESVTLSPRGHAWVARQHAQSAGEQARSAELQRAALTRALADNTKTLANLRHMRSREQITEAEFLADREELLREQARLNQELDEVSPEDRIEPEQAVRLISIRGLTWFDEGDGPIRRLILEAIGSNPTVAGGNLNVSPAYPFVRYDRKREIQQLCALQREVRTSSDRERLRRLVRLVKTIIEKRGECWPIAA